MTTVIANCQIDVITDEAKIKEAMSPAGKPFLLITLPTGVSFSITTNIAEMIGGAGAGVRKRHEDSLRQAH